MDIEQEIIDLQRKIDTFCIDKYVETATRKPLPDDEVEKYVRGLLSKYTKDELLTISATLFRSAVVWIMWHNK